MGTVDYSNIEGSLKQQQAEREAKEGPLPEGTYRVVYVGHERGVTPSKKVLFWKIHVKIKAPGSLYHNMKKDIFFREASDYYAQLQMENFFNFLRKLGLNLKTVKKEGDILDFLENVEEVRPSFDILAEDNVDKNGKVNENYPTNLSIVLDSVPNLVSGDAPENEVEGKVEEQEAEETAKAPAPAKAPEPPPAPTPAKAKKNPFLK